MDKLIQIVDSIDKGNFITYVVHIAPNMGQDITVSKQFYGDNKDYIIGCIKHELLNSFSKMVTDELTEYFAKEETHVMQGMTTTVSYTDEVSISFDGMKTVVPVDKVNVSFGPGHTNVSVPSDMLISEHTTDIFDGSEPEALPLIQDSKDLPLKGNVQAMLLHKLPFLTEVKLTCPVETCPQSQANESTHRALQFIIVHVNDTHKWSGDQIADWLETLDVDLTIPLEDDSIKLEVIPEGQTVDTGVSLMGMGLQLLDGAEGEGDIYTHYNQTMAESGEDTEWKWLDFSKFQIESGNIPLETIKKLLAMEEQNNED